MDSRQELSRINLISEVLIHCYLQSLKSKVWIWVPQAVLRIKGVDDVANGFLQVSCTVSEKGCLGILRHMQSRLVRRFFSQFPSLPHQISDAEHFQRMLAETPSRFLQTIELSLRSTLWAPYADIAPSEGARVLSDSPAAEVWLLYPLFTEVTALKLSFADSDTTRDRCL